jgi:integrase
MRGSIRKRGAGSYSIQVELERVAGKRRRRFITIQGTYKDAQKELTKLLNAADDGMLPEPTRTTVGAYLLSYLDGAWSGIAS